MAECQLRTHPLSAVGGGSQPALDRPGTLAALGSTGRLSAFGQAGWPAGQPARGLQPGQVLQLRWAELTEGGGASSRQGWSLLPTLAVIGSESDFSKGQMGTFWENHQ